MSDDPRLPPEGGEELDLGEIEDEAEGEDAELHDEAGEGEASDEGADGEESAEGDVDEPPRPRRKSQAQRWRERAERAEREAAEAKGYRQAAEQFRPQQQSPQVDYAAQQRAQQERAERLSMMTVDQQIEFVANEKAQQFQQMLLMQQLQTEDQLDRRDFDREARTSPIHAQYRDAVEAQLARERQAGNLRANREDILDKLVGRAQRERAAADAGRQRKTAARRVASAQTRPTNGRGDGAAGRGKQTWGDPEYDARMAAEALRKGIF